MQKSINRILLVLLTTTITLSLCNTLHTGGLCPAPCTCKWKGGKQTVECMDRGLITIPDSIDPETQVLDLSGNNLQILSRETFLRAGLVNLQRVFLRSCRIGQIDDMALRGLTNLIELDLSNNLLTSIPAGTLQDVPFLRDLVLANNPIQKIDGMAFKTVPGLIKLDLSNCEIQVIASRAFEGIELLESLKLNGNRLSELRLRTVEILTRLHGVELHDNPWHCDCRLRTMKEWLVQNNIPYPVAPRCSGGPERLIQKTFSDLHLDDFACKPEILPCNRYIEAVAGENASILCRANAVPAANIHWYWNGRPLTNNSALSTFPQRVHIYEVGGQEKKSTLILTNVHEVDAAEFYCVAENRAGNAEANFTLHTSMRAVGITALGGGQIAGLSVALVVLIIVVLLVVAVLLVRLRRLPFSGESKTPHCGHLEVVRTTTTSATLMNGGGGGGVVVATVKSPSISCGTNHFGEPPVQQSNSTELLNFYTNPVQKPPRSNNNDEVIIMGGGSSQPGSGFVSPSSISGNNPDLINDTNRCSSSVVANEKTDSCFVSAAGPSCNNEGLYPAGFWESDDTDFGIRQHHQPIQQSSATYHYNDKTPIITNSTEELHYPHQHHHRILPPYPTDYGLPPLEYHHPHPKFNGTNNNSDNNTVGPKTLRVWQKGAVPVLPPVTALKRALRSSPDEGYQEGCGTDV